MSTLRRSISALITVLSCLSTSLLADNPVNIIRGGHWDDSGRDFKVIAPQRKASGINGITELRLPNASLSFTVVADITVTALPESGMAAIVARPGFHQLLGLNANGTFCLTLWGADKKTFRAANSHLRAVCGQSYRVAGVIERIDESEYDLILYVNGREEGRAVLECAVYPYSGTVLVGGTAVSGPHAMPFSGIITNLWLCPTAMNETAIAALK